MDVGEWLAALGLERYADAFAENEVDSDVLATLTADDLKDLGVTLVGHRRRILDAISRRSDGSGDAPGPSATTAPAGRAPTAERRRVTVLFCDLVGSTSIGAGLDPEEYREIILGYQNAVAAEITRFDGQVAKFLGDGVLAYFGFPHAGEDTAERAVRAGLRATERVAQLTGPSSVPLATRVGIATGLVVIGDLIGEGMAQEQAIVGDTPNLAARLQDLAGAGGVIVADGTRQQLGDLFELEEMDGLRLKGFEEPVRAWKVRGEGTAPSRFHAFHERGFSTLVGRDEELALLLARWQQADNGEGQTVFLAGDGGIGKSRLVEELVARVDPVPVEILRYYGSPLRVHTAFHPVISLIKQGMGLNAADDPATSRAKLTAAFGEDAELIASLLSIPADGRPVVELTPQRRKALTIDALVRDLARRCEAGPVLVVVEDAHWLDPSSQELLEQLLRRVHGLRALVLVTFRPGYLPPSGSSLARETSLTLSRLVPAASRALIREVAGGRDMPDDVVEQILGKTEGVPMFVEELTKMILESGHLEQRDGRYVLLAPVHKLGIPATLHDSLMSRLDRLTAGKEIAQVGAVIGRDFSYDVLQAAMLRAIDPDPGLDELVAAGLVLRSGEVPDAFFTFKHALIQDAAYESLLTATRRDVHRRIATYLVEREPEVREQPELVARHFTEAGMPREATEHWLLAGNRAMERSGLEEALRDVERGIEVIAAQPDRDAFRVEEARLQTALGTALLMVRGQGAPEVLAAYQRAWELCAEGPDDGQMFPPLFGLYRSNLAQGTITTAHSAAERLAVIADHNANPTMQIAAQTALALSLFHLGDLPAARRHSLRGHAIYESNAGTHGPHSLFMIGQDPRVACLSCDAMSSALLGDLDQAIASATQALVFARAEAHLYSLGAALVWNAFTHRLRGEHSQVVELATEAIELSGHYSFGLWEGLAWLILGAEHTELGDPEHGIDELRQGVELLDDAGTLLFRPFVIAVRAQAMVMHGEHRAAVTLVDEGLELANRRSERWYIPELHRVRAEALRADPAASPDAVRHEFDTALGLARTTGLKTLELRAAVTAASALDGYGDRPGALAILQLVLEGFPPSDAPVVQVAARLRASILAPI